MPGPDQTNVHLSRSISLHPPVHHSTVCVCLCVWREGERERERERERNTHTYTQNENLREANLPREIETGEIGRKGRDRETEGEAPLKGESSFSS